jgi:phenylpropionate dioxygenase-like ring-hydroxylating dioxygenase large terminal subunit
MTKLLSAGELALDFSTQLPVHAYFSDALLAAERATLFKHGPHYVGHELMVPNVGDYHALKHENEGRLLVRDAHGIELVSNVCRHRQAKMLNGAGNASNIVCPLHRWTYDLKGELLGAPHFGDKPCLNLARTPLQSWNGLLFERNGFDIAAAMRNISVLSDLDFSGYVLNTVHVHECDYNWKTFIEVYLEDYHVEPFHPGLGCFVSCDDLRWEFGDHYSVQTVGVNSSLAKSGSPTYARWHEEVLKYRKGEPPKLGAIWLTLYPNIMVEWYPHVLVVSTLHPRGPQRTTNVVEFYYPEDIALFEPEFVAANQAAYQETCTEDDEIALRMDQGRKVLMDAGRNEVGPYQSPMEDGMQHFHAYLRRNLPADMLHG